jgi:hypothetical protein
MFGESDVNILVDLYMFTTNEWSIKSCLSVMDGRVSGWMDGWMDE